MGGLAWRTERGPGTVTVMSSTADGYRYQRIDLFTDTPFCGKPVTVFTDAAGLSEAEMQMIAREMGSAETIFLLPSSDPAHDYTVRVFSPSAEMAYQEKPGIGTAFALACQSAVSRPNPKRRLVFDASEGPVSTTMATPVTTVRQALPHVGGIYREPGVIPALLSLRADELIADAPVQTYSSGYPLLIVPLVSLSALRSIQFRTDIWERTVRQFEAPAIVAFALGGELSDTDVTIRVFLPRPNPVEDAATELAAGPVVRYLVDHRLLTKVAGATWTIDQGEAISRPSRLYAFPAWGAGGMEQLRVGGRCVQVGEGVIYL